MKKVVELIFLVSIALSFAVAKGEVTKVYAHYESATKSSYNKKGHKLKWGRGNNLVIDGFEYQGTHYKYQTMANKVKIIRHDNQNASGNPCGLFAERTSSGATYQYNPSFPTGCDMAKVMGGRIINVGALDLFRNSGSTAKNIERVDFIFESGIKAPANAVDLEKAGHVVTEKSGNNPIKIAAILSLDANGKPASYGPLVGVHTGTGIDYGITKIYVKNKNNPISKQYLAFLVNEKKGTQGEPWYLTKTHEPLGMAFVSLKELGVSAGTTYYGFSYFGEDVTSSHDLTKPETFPVDNLNDTADPYGGVAGYFQDEALPEIDSGTPFACTSQSFVSFNTSDNGSREGDSQFDTISLSDGSLVNYQVLNGVNGVNSIGYNVKDNYIWGYNLKLDKLVRIDAEGNTKLFDLPDGLPSGGYIAADVDEDGVLYLAERGANEIQRVNVNPDSDQFLKALTPLTIKNNKTISTADFAFNPKDGKLYYIEEGSGGEVYSIDPATGEREFVVDSGVDPYVVITFFDKDGNFYFNLGTGSAETNKLYKINMNDPRSATYFTDLDKGLTNGDGARCPNAEVVQPPATETLQAQDCSAAPSDMVTFNKEFDFDKNNDVTGDGGVGTVARYKNVATVNGQAIDLLVKVENLSGFSSLLNTDSTPKGFKFQKAGGDDPSVGFFIDQNRFDTKGTLYDATLRFTFVKHGTTEPVALNFESQVYDLDNFANRTEKVIIDKNDYKFFQLSEDSHIEGTILGDYHIFMNKENEDSSFPDKRASVKFVHENKSTFTMHFQHIKNKSMGQYGGKAGFNLVFGKTENGINTCQQPPAPAENECTLAFPGALSSTNDEIQINDQTKIYGTKNHTLITKSLSAKDTVRCDDAPCQASNTLAKTLAFDLDPGNGKDGDKILSDNQSLTISSNKEYTKFQTGQNNTITINGDLTIKSQSDFYINQGSKITINGNVVIYADKFDANQANQFTINGSLKIIANIFYLNSGNKLYNIPSADKFVVLAKDKVDINSQVDFKGLFYSGGDVQVNNDTHITGALTGNYIDVNDHSLIGYDTDAVQAFCDYSQPLPASSEPFTCDDTMYFSNASEIGTELQEENKMYLHSIDRSKSPFTFNKIGDAYDKTYNALGYNPVDNYLYAAYNNQLLKIDRDGVIHEMGIVDGLAERQNYAATFDKDGYYYLADWHNSSKIYKIDITQKKVIDTLTVKDQNGDALSMEFYDMVIDPSGKYLYMMQIVDLAKGESQLVKMELATGKTSAVGKVVKNGEPDTIFCDITGRIFVLYKKNGFYEVNATTGAQKLISNAPTLANLNDGAMCSNATVNLNPILSIADVVHKEGDHGTTDFAFKVSLSKPAPEGMSFWYTVTDGSDSDETRYHGASLDDHDMDGISGCMEVVKFNSKSKNFDVYGSHDEACQKIPEGMTSITIHTNVNGDFKIESDERFFVDIYAPEKALIADGRGEGIILNDDYNITLNAVTVGSPVGDANGSLTTQIVNKPFELKIGAYYDYNGTVVPDVLITKIDAVDQTHHEGEKNLFSLPENMINSFKSMFNMGNSDNVSTPAFADKITGQDGIVKIENFNIDKAYKNYRLKITGIYHGKTFTSTSADAFAVRPDKFKITLPDDLVAGKDFNLTVEAMDANNAPVVNYEENLSVALDYNNTKAGQGCVRGDLDIESISFEHGVATLKAKYSDIGEVEFKVYEKAGDISQTHEFAYIDRDDNGSKSLIDSDSKISSKFKPGELKIDWELKPGDEMNGYTYYNSFDPEHIDDSVMAAILKVRAEVKNADGQLLQNFSKTCQWADDINLSMDTVLENETRQPLELITHYRDQNGTVIDDSMITKLHVTIKQNATDLNTSGYTLDKRLFEQGKGEKVVYFNIKRSADKPLNPLRLTINGMTTQFVSDPVITHTGDNATTFLYIRAHIPDQTIVGKKADNTIAGDAAIFYEVYCKDCNRTKFGLQDLPESVDSIHWYQWSSISESSKKFDQDFGAVNHIPYFDPESIIATNRPQLKSISQSVADNKLHLEVSKAPFKARIHYKPKKYLIYNPFRSDADEHGFNVTIVRPVTKWAGRGDEGMTVDKNINPRNNMDIIDW